MSRDLLVRNYCEALFKESKDECIHVQEELLALLELCNNNETLYSSLTSEVVKENTKTNIINALLKNNKFSSYTANLLNTLIKNKRFYLFKEIANTFKKFSNQSIAFASVTSSGPLDEKSEAEVVKMLEKKFGIKFEINTKIDEEILGGLIIEYGSIILDLSLKGQIELIREHSMEKLNNLRHIL